MITPPTLIHTLRACSMLSLPSSYGYVLDHTRVYIETVILCPRLETLLPSFTSFLLSNLTTATNLSPNQTLSFLFKLLLLNINMWQSACDDLCPSFSFSFPALPLFPRCCCFQVLRVLDPPCTYSPTLNITSARWSFTCLLRDSLGPGHAGNELSRDMLPPSRPQHGCLRLRRNFREMSTPLR